MRTGLIFLRERFDHFNTLCFAGKLPDVTLRISSSLRTLGTLRHPRYITSSTRPEELVLSISNRLDLDVRVIEDTIIHEMIHLYITWFRIPDTSTHGRVFRTIMTNINRTHGRNITISHRGNAEEKETDRIRKPRIVILSEMRTGETCITVCNPRYAISIYETLSKSPSIKALKVLASYASLFAMYPASKTPKVYRIDTSSLKTAMDKAVFLEYKDGKLRPVQNRE